MIQLEGKTCIVSGGANGLGAAMAKGLAQAGANVVVADLDTAGIEQVVQRIKAAAAPGDCVACRADITREDDVQSICDTAVQRFGRIDVVVNNAGTGAQIVRPDFISSGLPSWEVPPDKWRRIMDVNSIGPFLLSRVAIPHMLARGWGRIINMSTTWETMLRPGFASYGPSKAALEAMSVGMAKELESHGITVNTVHPGGPVDTAQVPADIGVARDKLLRPEVMVPLVLWLASDASAHITATRFTAAKWNANSSADVNVAQASEPAAWPQLVRDIVMEERGNLT